MKKNINISRNKKVIILSLCVALLAGIIFCISKLQYLKYAADQSSIVSIRELIVMAGENLRKPAPVEAKTGDVYFPEAKVYLPSPQSMRSITYLYNDDSSSTNPQPELSIGTNPVYRTESLYSANNIEDLFSKVPEFQECSRGIHIFFDDYDDRDSQLVLASSVLLADGRTVQIYTETNCPELNELASQLKNLTSY